MSSYRTYLADLAREQAIALARLVSPTQTIQPEPEQPDELLTRDQVAAILKVEPSQVHRVSALRPHRVRLSHKVIRYRRSGVERLRKRGAA